MDDANQTATSVRQSMEMLSPRNRRELVEQLNKQVEPIRAEIMRMVRLHSWPVLIVDHDGSMETEIRYRENVQAYIKFLNERIEMIFRHPLLAPTPKSTNL